jgi:hypothetical protein
MIRQTLAGGQTKYKVPATSDKLQVVDAISDKLQLVDAQARKHAEVNKRDLSPKNARGCVSNASWQLALRRRRVLYRIVLNLSGLRGLLR